MKFKHNEKLHKCLIYVHIYKYVSVQSSYLSYSILQLTALLYNWQLITTQLLIYIYLYTIAQITF